MLLIRAASFKSNTKLLIKAEFCAFHKSVVILLAMISATQGKIFVLKKAAFNS